MKTLTVTVLTLVVVYGMNSPNKHAMRFTELSDLLINQEEMYRKVSLCTSAPKRIVDSTGHSWPNFCYQSPSGDEFEIIFTRLYSGDHWTYAIDQHIGYPEFQFRVIEHIKPCEEETEVDGEGAVWTVWRYVNGSPVLFQRRDTATAWTYVEDREGGVRECQYRRIVHDDGKKEDQFEETPWTFFWDVFGLEDEDETDWPMGDSDDVDEAAVVACPESPTVSVVPTPSILTNSSVTPKSQDTADCYPLESDGSDRYFWTQFDADGKTVDFERDSRGVFIISNRTHLRIPIDRNVTEDEAVEQRHIALACPVNDTNGTQVQFQPDEEIAGVYWVEDGVQYQYSTTEEDKVFGMYHLNETSGKRIPVSEGSGST